MSEELKPCEHSAIIQSYDVDKYMLHGKKTEIPGTERNFKYKCRDCGAPINNPDDYCDPA